MGNMQLRHYLYLCFLCCIMHVSMCIHEKIVHIEPKSYQNQALLPCEKVQCKMQLVIALDGSGSIMPPVEFDREKTFVKNLVKRFYDPSGNIVRLGFLIFSTEANIIFDVGNQNTLPELEQLILDVIQPKLAIATRKAIVAAMNMTANYNGQNVLLLITDGDANQHSLAVMAGKGARAAGLQMVGVGIGQQYNMSKLVEIIGNRKDVLPLPDFSAVDGAICKIEHLLCTAAISAPSPSTTIGTDTAPTTTTPRPMSPQLQQCTTIKPVINIHVSYIPLYKI